MATLALWRRWWKAAGCKGDADKTFARFMPLYCGPNRFYHTGEHIEFCLAQLSRYVGCEPRKQDTTLDPLVVEMAIWLHDAIMHVPNAEEQSAGLARDICKRAKLSEEFTRNVVYCIAATDHSSPFPAEAHTENTRVMSDIDLAILGQHRATYATYTLNIRREYADVTADRYTRGRLRFMVGLLTQDAIYHTPFFGQLYTQQARKNIKEEIHDLMEDIH